MPSFNLIKKKNEIKQTDLIRLLLLLFITINLILRFFKLGYSNFQGDEVAAQNYLFGELSFSEFLLSRTIGPMQYLISKAVNVFVFNKMFNTELYVRLPFTLAGVASTYIMYLVGKKLSSKNVGLISGFLLAGSGLFFAFSRIVQYQSFILLLALVIVLLFFNFIETGNKTYLFWLGTLSAVAFLFHYDSLSFIIPLFAFLLLEKELPGERRENLIYFLAPLISIPSLFYIPYVLKPSFKSTLAYLYNIRINSQFQYDSLYYSLKLLLIYHSKEFLVLLFLSSFIFFIVNSRRLTTKILYSILLGLIILRVFAVYQSDLLILISVLVGLSIFVQDLFTRDKDCFNKFVRIWFIFSFLCYGLFFTEPLTHIYTFLIPLFLLAALGLNLLFKKHYIFIFFTILIVGISSISYNFQAFVNPNPEYPWNRKSYIFGKMYRGVSNGEQIDGIFGFPYNRNLSEIRQKVLGMQVKAYASNEKYRIMKYYLRGFSWDYKNNDIFIWIENPQSLSKKEKPDKNPIIVGKRYEIFSEK